MGVLDGIDSIVVVMMENRSFDHILGHLHHPAYGNRADIDGIGDPAETDRYDNPYQGRIYKPFPAADVRLAHDLPHHRAKVAVQLGLPATPPPMNGFVAAYGQKMGSVEENPPCMGFLKPDAVPMSSFLAKNFLVCNRWFAPLPSSTQPNRATAFTGSSLLDDDGSWLIPHHHNVFHWLKDQGVSWRVYSCGLSFFLLMGLFKECLGDHFKSFNDLAGDVTKEQPHEVPRVIFIEPCYGDSPVHFGFQPDDNHPPLPVAGGEKFLHTVYTLLTQNPDRWARTMLIVIHDEHGGFYDHVAPPAVRMDPPPNAKYKDPFTTAGVRVPAMIASPIVAPASVSNVTLDHTSILQLFAEKFAGDATKYSDDVNRRMQAGIGSVSQALAGAKNAAGAAANGSKIPAAPAFSLTTESSVVAGEKLPATQNQSAFVNAVRGCLQQDRTSALKHFPELAMFGRTDGVSR